MFLMPGVTTAALKDEVPETAQSLAAGQLRAIIERIERLEQEKKGNYILDSRSS